MRARIGGSRLRAASVIACFVVLVLPGSAVAHAELVRPIPADGETVTAPVTVISGRYSEDMAGNSKLQVLDQNVTTVATGGVDPEDDRRMVARPASPLGNGTYTVKSTTVSAEDGDIDRQEWTFSVAIAATPTASPSSAEPTPICTDLCSGQPSGGESVTPSPAQSASPSPTASPTPSDTSGGSNDVLLPILAGLAIVAIGAGFLLNRNRSPRV
jgi:methionine-rich copper-binding protein CopC